MKKILLIGLSSLTTLFLASCETHTQSGALAGAIIGAGTGALIAENEDGAIIGGAIGSIAGSIIGDSLDHQEQRFLYHNSPTTLHRIENRQDLSLYDIIALNEARISDQIIINQIISTESIYYLSAQDIIFLKKSGISDHVINFMIKTKRY